MVDPKKFKKLLDIIEDKSIDNSKGVEMYRAASDTSYSYENIEPVGLNYVVVSQLELDRKLSAGLRENSIELFKFPVLDSYDLGEEFEGSFSPSLTLRIDLCNERGLYSEKIKALSKVSEIVDSIVFDIISREYRLFADQLVNEERETKLIKKLRGIFYKNDPKTKKLNSKFKKKIRRTHELACLQEGSLIAEFVTSPDYIFMASLLMQSTVVESLKMAWIETDLHNLFRRFLKRPYNDKRLGKDFGEDLGKKIVNKISTEFKNDLYEIKVSESFDYVEIKERSEDREGCVRREISLVLKKPSS